MSHVKRAKVYRKLVIRYSVILQLDEAISNPEEFDLSIIMGYAVTHKF